MVAGFSHIGSLPIFVDNSSRMMLKQVSVRMKHLARVALTGSGRGKASRNGSQADQAAATTFRARRTKLSINRNPIAWLFSGWNWTAAPDDHLMALANGAP